MSKYWKEFFTRADVRVRDVSGALYCFVKSNLKQEITFCKAIKAGVAARPD
jgi:hypothetical protein